MKSSIHNGFGNIQVTPVSVRRKTGLVLCETGGMSATRIGRAEQGDYLGRYILYRTHTEMRAVYKGKPLVFIPMDACLGLVELEPDEIAEPIITVDELVGQDTGWYGG